MDIIDEQQYIARILLSIYDSANCLFNEEKRLGDEDTFSKLLSENELILTTVDLKAVGFLTYNSVNSKYIEISGLYVSQEHQNSGVASAMMDKLKTLGGNRTLFSKVLNNAPWAKNFYMKHKFVPISENHDFFRDVPSFSNNINRSTVFLQIPCI